MPPVVGSTLGSLGAALAGQAAILISGIVAARALGPANRGHLALLALGPTVLSHLVLLGAVGAVTYFIARDPGRTRAVVRLMLAPAIAQIVASILIQSTFVWLLMRHESREVQLSGVLSIAVGPALVFQSYGLGILQGLQRFRWFNVFRLLPAILYSVFLVTTIVLGAESLFATMLVWTVANLIASAGTAFVVMRQLPPRTPSPSDVDRAQILRFGAKGFLGAASPLETFRLDQLVVGLYLAPVALGIYVTSLAFTNLPRFISQSVSMVALPHIAGQPTDRLARRAMWRFFTATLLGSMVVATILGVSAGRIVPFVFGADFSDAVRPTQILLAASVLFGARRILGEGLRARGYPGVNTAAELISWVWLLPALALLAPRWELNGVAFAIFSAALISLGAVIGGVFRLRQQNEPVSVSSTVPSWAMVPQAAKSRPRRTLRVSPPSLIVVNVSVVCAFLGWSGSRMPVTVFMGVAILLALVPLTYAAQRLLRRVDGRAPRATDRRVTTAIGVRELENLAIPRLLYYCGTATVTFLVVRPIGFLTISDWLFLGSFVLTVVILGLRERLSFGGIPKGIVVGTVVYAIGAGVSSLTTPDIVASLAVLARFVYLTLVWFWLGTIVLEKPRHLRTALICWTGSAAITGLASLAQLRFGDVIPGATPFYGRMTGLAQHFNDLGSSTALAIVPALAVVGLPTSGARKLLYAGVIVPLIVAGTVLSGSVSGLTAVGVGVLVWVGIRRVSPRFIVSGAVVMLGLYLVLDLQRDAGAPSPIDRIRGTTDSSSAYCTLCSRLDTNTAAWNAITESPFVGAGLATVTSTGKEVHNMLLGSWFEAGLLGLIGIVTIMAAVGVTAVSAIRAARSDEEWNICVALLASFLAVLVLSMAQPILFQRFGWMGAALILVYARQQRADARIVVDPDVVRSSVRTRSYPRAIRSISGRTGGRWQPSPQFESHRVKAL